MSDVNCFVLPYDIKDTCLHRYKSYYVYDFIYDKLNVVRGGTLLSEKTYIATNLQNREIQPVLLNKIYCIKQYKLALLVNDNVVAIWYKGRGVIHRNIPKPFYLVGLEDMHIEWASNGYVAGVHGCTPMDFGDFMRCICL